MSAPQDRDHAEAWHPYDLETAAIADLDTRVHVWRVGLDNLSDRIGHNLSDDEWARAKRFTRTQDRRRFVAARAVLRTILADLLEAGDAARGRHLRFVYGPAGKPFLADDPGLRFNVSHSEGLAMIAATRAGDVGIDVERQRAMRDMTDIARFVFNEAERAAMLGCPPSTREGVFYRIWTRKEALLKAMGIGIASLKDPDAASLAHASTAWLVTTLPHLDGYAAALARPRGAHGLRLWSWPSAVAMRGVERRARRRPLPGEPKTAARSIEVSR